MSGGLPSICALKAQRKSCSHLAARTTLHPVPSACHPQACQKTGRHRGRTAAPGRETGSWAELSPRGGAEEGAWVQGGEDRAGDHGGSCAERAQWAVRGALRTAAPGACPRCTVSFKLQQLAGHRNLITRPCPFPHSHAGPGEAPEEKRPFVQREKRESCAALGLPCLLPGRSAPPSRPGGCSDFLLTIT